MNNISLIAASAVTAMDLSSARLGQRFGRLDLQSQLALLAVASLKINFDELPRERIGIVLSASAGSLTTDLNYWQGRNGIGGPSPTLFAYTLPSAAVGEIAIHFKLTGPNLCFVGDDKTVLPEAYELIRRGEADGCVCVHCEVISETLAEMIARPAVATARAVFLQRVENPRGWPEFDRDTKSLCTLVSLIKSVS